MPHFFCHSFMNCGLKHFGNDEMQLSYLHASICANISFNFLKEVVRDKRWPAATLFVVNISPSFGEFMALLRHSLPIHNVSINSNNLFVNFLWTFTIALRNLMTEGALHLGGGTLDGRCPFKHILLKQSPFYHCLKSTAHR